MFGCASQNTGIELSAAQQSTDELLQFAKANCFFGYFKKKGYELDDIRSISGGIVETGSYSADIYQRVSLLVKDYSPVIQTKQDIDVDLLKCFKLDSDPDFIQSLDKLK
jgi:hypothetical protein